MTVYKVKKTVDRIGLYTPVFIVALPILFSLYFVFISSLKNMPQVYTMPPQLFGFTPIWDHYKYIFEMQRYDTYMMDSTIVVFASTVISLILGVPASYSIARFHMRKTSTSILVARPLSSILSLPSYYFLFSKFKMADIYSVLILSYTVPSLPLIVWTMLSSVADIPKELDEIATVDGCTRQRYFWSVILSVNLPGFAACVALSLLGSWSNFQFALILSGEKTRTLPVSLQYFISGTDIHQGRMLTAAIVVIIPTAVLTMAL